jgi:hypothetical protein
MRHSNRAITPDSCLVWSSVMQLGDHGQKHITANGFAV